MSGKRSRNKGAAGEREFIKLLQEVADEKIGKDIVKLKRNLMQTAEGGADITIAIDGVNVPSFFALEVKRQETLNLKSWWKQTLEQTNEEQVPILAYRQSRKDWRIITLGSMEDLKMQIEINLEDFLHWFGKKLGTWYDIYGKRHRHKKF